jgi:hypothetical protein
MAGGAAQLGFVCRLDRRAYEAGHCARHHYWNSRYRSRVFHTQLWGAALTCAPRSAWKAYSLPHYYNGWCKKRGLVNANCPRTWRCRAGRGQDVAGASEQGIGQVVAALDADPYVFHAPHSIVIRRLWATPEAGSHPATESVARRTSGWSNGLSRPCPLFVRRLAAGVARPWINPTSSRRFQPRTK